MNKDSKIRGTVLACSGSCLSGSCLSGSLLRLAGTVEVKV
jgi:hypothetical protein